MGHDAEGRNFRHNEIAKKPGYIFNARRFPGRYSVLALFLLAGSGSFSVNAQSDPQSAVHRAQSLEDQGNFSSAAALLVETLQRYPNSATVNFQMGTLALHQQNWASAIRYFRHCALLQPRDTDTLFYLGQAYYLNGETVAALQTLDKAVHLDSSNALLLQKRGEYRCNSDGNCESGLRDLLRARTLDPGLAQIDFEVGIAQYKHRDTDAARASFEAELYRNPTNAEAHYYLGELSAQTLHWEEAKLQYQQAVLLDPTRGDYQDGLGRSLMALEEFAAAVPVLKRTVELDPTIVNAHFQLASAYRHLGSVANAKQEMLLFRAAHDRVDSEQDVVLVRSQQDEASRQHVKELVESGTETALSNYLDQLSRLASRTDRQRDVQLGIVYVLFDKPDRAIAALRRAAIQYPTDPDVHAWLGRALLLRREIPAARAELNQAVRLQPENQAALIGLGGLDYSLGRWEEAIKYLEASHTRQAEILVELCDSYARIGEMDKAQLTAELIHVFDPEDEDSATLAKRILQRNLDRH